VSELPDERQLLRVLADAYAATLKARRSRHRERAAGFLAGCSCFHVREHYRPRGLADRCQRSSIPPELRVPIATVGRRSRSCLRRPALS